VSERGLMSHLT